MVSFSLEIPIRSPDCINEKFKKHQLREEEQAAHHPGILTRDHGNKSCMLPKGVINTTLHNIQPTITLDEQKCQFPLTNTE